MISPDAWNSALDHWEKVHAGLFSGHLLDLQRNANEFAIVEQTTGSVLGKISLDKNGVPTFNPTVDFSESHLESAIGDWFRAAFVRRGFMPVDPDGGWADPAV